MEPVRTTTKRRVKKMRPARNPAIYALTLVLLTIVAFPAVAQDPQHGGSMTNTHNDIYIVQGSAENPLQINPGPGKVEVKETISFANDDPLKVPDYGIVYVDPRFTIHTPTARITEFTWDYTVTNFTLQLFNVTTEYWGNFTGIVNETHSLAPGTDLNPDEDGQPHPRVNATYLWQVKVVSAEGSEIMTYPGGEVVTEIFNDTVFDLAPLGLPPLGETNHEAGEDELNDLWVRAILEPHPTLKDGFYRFRISEMVFEYGMSLTIEVRYTGQMVGNKINMDKLVFNPRLTHTDVYLQGGMEVFIRDQVGGEGIQIPPTETSPGAGEPTKFTTEETFSLTIREKGADGTDWGLYGRYALLAILIVALLFLVLWSGRSKPTVDDEDDWEEDPETAAKRAELEDRKTAILAQIKELDQRHEDGKLGTGVYNRKRKRMKAQAVDVMRELDELDGGSGPAYDDEEPEDEDTPSGTKAELMAEKTEILERIKELDARHEDGDITDEVWKRKRKHLKAEAIEIMQEIEALD
jgi:hypothetical protein